MPRLLCFSISIQSYCRKVGNIINLHNKGTTIYCTGYLTVLYSILTSATLYHSLDFCLYIALYPVLPLAAVYTCNLSINSSRVIISSKSCLLKYLEPICSELLVIDTIDQQGVLLINSIEGQIKYPTYIIYLYIWYQLSK